MTSGALSPEARKEPLEGRHLYLSEAEIAAAFPYAALDASLWRYYVAATSTEPADVSAIERDRRTGDPVAGLVAAEGSDDVAFFGRAATFEFASELAPRDIPAVGRRLAEELRDRARQTGRALMARAGNDTPVLTGFERVLLATGASASLEFSAEADLRLTEDQLWGNFRQSLRSRINTGRRELTIELVDETAPDRERFEVYRSLHREVAGRVTRPAASWDVMHELLTEGRAQLILAHLGERTVAATYFMRFGRLALYASGAYVRDLEKFPVSHWPLYASMLAAKHSGVERLVIGPVFLENDPHATPKERSIGAFKVGFATEVRTFRTYVLQPHAHE